MRRLFGYLRDMLVAFLPEDYRPEWALRESPDGTRRQLWPVETGPQLGQDPNSERLT